MDSSSNSWDTYKSLNEKYWRHTWGTSPTAHNRFRYPSWTITMKFALLISLAAAGSVSASAVCAVCSKTIFYAGATRTLTSAKEEGSNTLQCKWVLKSVTWLYRSENSIFTRATIHPLFPASTLTATTLWVTKGSHWKEYKLIVAIQNINGALLLSNTGGACPNPATRVTQPGPACTLTS